MAMLSLMMMASAAVGAVGTCNIKTTGNCNFIGCYAWRGPTSCVGSFGSKNCQCDEGYCTSPDSSTCVKETADMIFKVGDAVDARDSKENVWLPGKVTALKPEFLVKPDGFSKAFSFEYVDMAAPKFTVGAVVESCDSGCDDESNWKAGVVKTVSPLTVQPEGWDTAFPFANVRPQDWQKQAAARAANEKKAQEELKADADKADAEVAAAKKHEATDEAQLQRVAAEASAVDAKVSAAKAEQEKLGEAALQRADEEAKAVAAAHSADEKKKASDTALKHANQKAQTTAGKAAEAAEDLREAQAELAKRKAALAAGALEEKKEIATVAEIKESMDAAEKAHNQPLYTAMHAAYEAAVRAENATHQLKVHLQADVVPSVANASEKATALSKADTDAKVAKAEAEKAAHDLAQEEASAATADKAAKDAKAATEQARKAEKEAAKIASKLEKEAQELHDEHEKSSKKVENDKEEVAHLLNVAGVARAKSEAANAAWPQSTKDLKVSLYVVQPKSNDSNGSLVAIACLAAVTMIATGSLVLWQGRRASVVAPEYQVLLG